jgi:hypothetical protein
MLKTMYQQFLLGEHARVVRDGKYPRNIGVTCKYYKYQSFDNKKCMSVILRTELKIAPQDLPEYIANDLVKISYIEFSEI